MPQLTWIPRILKCRESIARAQIEWIILQSLCAIVVHLSLSAVRVDVCMNGRVLAHASFCLCACCFCIKWRIFPVGPSFSACCTLLKLLIYTVVGRSWNWITVKNAMEWDLILTLNHQTKTKFIQMNRSSAAMCLLLLLQLSSLLLLALIRSSITDQQSNTFKQSEIFTLAFYIISFAMEFFVFVSLIHFVYLFSIDFISFSPINCSRKARER